MIRAVAGFQVLGGDGELRPLGGETAPGCRPSEAAHHALGARPVSVCYLLGAVALTWRLWADPASRMQIGDGTDVNLFAWFIRYSAQSVTHGSLPAFVTTAMNAPHGINLMWNTSLLLPGVLLTPVTLLAGPQTSLTLLHTGLLRVRGVAVLGAAALGVRIGPAALGGAVYGFSPALVAAAVGHYHLEFAVPPPLLIDALLRIVTGRGHALKTGIWLACWPRPSSSSGSNSRSQRPWPPWSSWSWWR